MSKKRAFKELNEAGKDIVAEVDDRMLSGQTARTVATWLHEEKGLFKNLKLSSLKKNLERYRATTLKDRVVGELTEKAWPGRAQNVKKRLLALDEMERIVAIQTGRMEKLLIKEQQLPEGILLNQARDELRLLKEMVTELGKLQLETGVMARAPKRLTGTVTSPDGEKREFTWTEEQERLMVDLDRLEYQIDAEIEDAEVIDA
jgi:hypothetical protein